MGDGSSWYASNLAMYSSRCILASVWLRKEYDDHRTADMIDGAVHEIVE